MRNCADDRHKKKKNLFRCEKKKRHHLVRRLYAELRR
jgi:hypothetical protein